MPTRNRKRDVPEKYKAAIAKVKAAREEAQKMAGIAFREGADDIFKAHPRLQSFGWTQYTPYFNDGDTCYFGVHAYDGEMQINGFRPDYDDEEDEETQEGQDPLSKDKKEWDEIQSETAEFVLAFAEEDLEKLFGEGLVVIHRDGKTETQDYEHD